MRKAYWYQGNWTDERYNIGDGMTPFILQHVLGRYIFRERDQNAKGKLLSCGSVIEFLQDGDVVWGSGLIKPMALPLRKDVRFLMVRGPVTRTHLRGAGYDLPEAYGDPCELLPMIVPNYWSITHEVGWVPHYADSSKGPDGAHYISIIGNVETFVREICQCARIVSSSLHGLAIAAAYGRQTEYVPCRGVIGGSFKFVDYWQGLDSKYHLTPTQMEEAIWHEFTSQAQ